MNSIKQQVKRLFGALGLITLVAAFSSCNSETTVEVDCFGSVADVVDWAQTQWTGISVIW
jgi:hypothetical protein